MRTFNALFTAFIVSFSLSACERNTTNNTDVISLSTETATAVFIPELTAVPLPQNPSLEVHYIDVGQAGTALLCCAQ